MNSPKLSPLPDKGSHMGLKDLIGKKITKKYKFCNQDVNIAKLTVQEVKNVQEVVRRLQLQEGQDVQDDDGYELLRLVVRSSVEGAEELSDEDFLGFPLDELNKLTQEIMKFSGMGSDSGKA